MARLPRAVLPGIPCHAPQRGNGRQKTFFEDGDHALYLDTPAATADRAQLRIWSHCLMPNHVHITLCPQDVTMACGEPPGDLHRRCTGFIHARRRTTGHLRQGRFGSARLGSAAMDQAHFVTAPHYVALNPGRAGLVRKAQDWPWLSTRALIAGQSDHVVDVAPRWNGSAILPCPWGRISMRR